MASKKSLIDSLNKQNYSLGEVKELLNRVTKISDEYPLYLKKGDVFSFKVGQKKRPVVIIKVLEESVIGIPLSTTKDIINLCEYNSRFFGKGYFGKALVTCKIEEAKEYYIGIYDNVRSLNNAIKKIKEYLISNI